MNLQIDVIAVDIHTRAVTVIAENTNEKDAESIAATAINRRHTDGEFLIAVPTGAYRNGDTWRGYDRRTI